MKSTPVVSQFDQVYLCATRIEVSKGDDTKHWGTGALLGATETTHEEPETFIVTCRHVLEDATSAKFSFPLRKDLDSIAIGVYCEFAIDDIQAHVYYHPSQDLAMVKMSALLEVGEYIRTQGNSNVDKLASKRLPLSMFSSGDESSDLDSVSGVIFLGPPIGIMDKTSMLPLIRTGWTATPEFLDFEGEPSFLIDAPVFIGSSGSPVLTNPGIMRMNRKTRKRQIDGAMRFLGIITDGYGVGLDGTLKREKIPTNLDHEYDSIHADLGLVLKARVIRDFIIKNS